MAEHPPSGLPETATGDRDVDTRALYRFLAVLFVIMAVSMGAMWAFSVFFRNELTSSDPPPPVLEEARAKPLPPEPRLETNPPTDLKELREREDATLNGWSWVDRERGVAQIPVARAAEIVVDKGLLSPAPATASPAPAIPAGAAGNPADKGKRGTKSAKTEGAK